jgi:diguanylate cyclase (GGDEF)-like protein
MMLDLPTLMIAGAFAAAMSGALLLFAWWHFRETSAAVWWAAGDFALALGVLLLALGFIGKSVLVFLMGLTFIAGSPALTWVGALTFRGRPVRPPLVCMGLFVWAATVGTRPLHGLDAALLIVSSLVVAGYTAATAWELAKCKTENLRAGLPLTVLFTLHATMYLILTPESLRGNMNSLEPAPLASWFGLVHFETIVYVIGTAVFFVALMKERSEQHHREAANTDVLTGLPNRRAFLAAAERLLARCRADGAPLTIACFDLDHFKAVNDTFGHAIGDRVLQVFAETARSALRPGDMISRIGGEEFAAVLPAASLQAGCATADRVRNAFAEAGLSVDGQPIGATVSAGVSVVDGVDIALTELMERADKALYQAKLNGRNRVECTADSGAKAYPHLVRVA